MGFVALQRSILRSMTAAAFAAVVSAGCSVDGTPDAGTLDPVFARPAEDVRILSLGRGQTLGELLEGAVDGTEQYGLLLAFQEQASPIKSFMEDMCDVGENFREATADIYKHWTIWRKTKGYKFAQNECAFGKQLISADMRIGKGRVQIEGRRRKVYKGIQLNEDKVKSFVLDSMGEESWSKAIDEFSRSHQADIIDIFSWAETNNRPS